MTEPKAMAGGCTMGIDGSTETLEVFRAIARALERGTAVALCTVEATAGSTPREAGSRMTVPGEGRPTGTVGGGALELAIVERARGCLQTGRGETAELALDAQKAGGLAAECGGTVRVRIEVLGAPRRLVVFGAGHVGAATARVARDAGLLPLVIDDRADALEPLAAEGLAVRSAPAEEAVAAAALRCEDCVVVVTRGHEHDERVVTDALKQELAYVGMIGSRRKVETTRKALARAGIPPARIDALHAPIGIDIGAETPGELAVCIVAEVIGVLRQGRSRRRPET
ncbi:MAG: XdhC family protein [Deltaproteobacteria bacterium]|nr:XdhC family protein [Deltaproteobacteria bacterium]